MKQLFELKLSILQKSQEYQTSENMVKQSVSCIHKQEKILNNDTCSDNLYIQHTAVNIPLFVKNEESQPININSNQNDMNGAESNVLW